MPTYRIAFDYVVVKLHKLFSSNLVGLELKSNGMDFGFGQSCPKVEEMSCKLTSFPALSGSPQPSAAGHREMSAKTQYQPSAVFCRLPRFLLWW